MKHFDAFEVLAHVQRHTYGSTGLFLDREQCLRIRDLAQRDSKAIRTCNDNFRRSEVLDSSGDTRSDSALTSIEEQQALQRSALIARDVGPEFDLTAHIA